MDSLLIVDLNSCCNSLLKLKYWLILAEYGASKLELIKQITLDAALDDFECRTRLERRFKQQPVDKFIKFASDAYRKAAKSVSDFIGAPDWTIFNENGDFFRYLETIIRNEIDATSALMTYESHFGCLETFHNLRDEILSIVNSWSEVSYVYTTYTSACLSSIFTKRTTRLIDEYENHPSGWNTAKLLEEITGVKTDAEQECENSFWFVSKLLNLHTIEESPNLDDLYESHAADDDLSTKLSVWIVDECSNEFRAFTRRVWHHPTGDIEQLDSEMLNSNLNIPIEDLESNMNGVRLSDGPHYLIERRALAEMRTTNETELSRMNLENELLLRDKKDFDFIDSILQESGDTQFNVYVSHIKDELNESFSKDFTNLKRELGVYGDGGGGGAAVADSTSAANIENRGDGITSTRKSTESADDTKCTKTQHKKRGRPKKLDEYNQTAPKHGQHKYSPENVLDCSTWISDNFYDVPGNKPAIDRARLYELYTNYCTLKFCTPVDRALFGKIIRKVFPELKSRRLIQNQVLKYHYVGLQPKHPELEQALLYANSSINPQEMMVSYVPVEE